VAKNTYRVAQKLANFLYALTLPNIRLTDFQNCFTVRIKRKFVIVLSLKIPPHLKCVAQMTNLTASMTQYLWT